MKKKKRPNECKPLKTTRPAKRAIQRNANNNKPRRANNANSALETAKRRSRENTDDSTKEGPRAATTQRGSGSDTGQRNQRHG